MSRSSVWSTPVPIPSATTFVLAPPDVTLFNKSACICNSNTRHRANVLANILRSLFVARTPSEEARSPGRRRNVENAPCRRPITGEPATPTSHIRRAILRTPPVTRQSAASSARRPCPTGRSHYVVISQDGRKLVTRVLVVAITTQPVPRLQIRPLVHN